MALRIRRDDTVRVIAGKDRGRTGRVKSVDPKKQKVYVEGVNIVKRHIKPRTLRDTQRAQEARADCENDREASDDVHDGDDSGRAPGVDHTNAEAGRHRRHGGDLPDLSRNVFPEVRHEPNVRGVDERNRFAVDREHATPRLDQQHVRRQHDDGRDEQT